MMIASKFSNSLVPIKSERETTTSNCRCLSVVEIEMNDCKKSVRVGSRFVAFSLRGFPIKKVCLLWLLFSGRFELI